MRCSCLVLALALFFWVACRSSFGPEANKVKPASEVEKAFNKVQDLNSTRERLTDELIGVRDQLFALPKDAPSTMELTRKYTALNFRVRKMAGDVYNAQLEWQAELQKAEEAKRQAEEERKKAKEAVEAKKVVAKQGALRLYAYSIKSSPNKAVVGEVENTGIDVETDVAVEFELFDSDDKSVGTVTDNTPSIEPGARWTFNALILDEAAERAHFKSIIIKGAGDLPSLPGSKPEQ